MPLLIAFVMAAVLVPACGGNWRRLASVGLRYEAGIVALFVAQALVRSVFPRVPGLMGLTVVCWAVAALGLTVLLLLNHDVPGASLMAIGLLLNEAVVLLNAGMPVTAGLEAAGRSRFYSLMGEASLAPWLGDSMPLRFMGTGVLLSPGDVVLGVGLCVLAVAAGLDAGTDAQREAV